MAQMVRAMGARHRVELLAFRGAEEPGIGRAVVARCEGAREVWRPEPGRSPAARAVQHAREARAGLAGVPAWALLLRSDAFARQLVELVSDFRPEVVQLENDALAQYLPVLASSPAARVLVVHEPAAAAALERWRSARGARRARRRLELRARRTWERKVLRQVDAAVVFTARDGRSLAAPPPATFVVPLGTDIPAQALDPYGADPPSLVFVGNFTHPPNVDAATTLLTEIVPRVRRAVPRLRTYVVGPRPPVAITRLAAADTIVTGVVPAVEPYLARAGVVVAPVWSGGGMRVKALEALAAGKALVATPLAVEGIGVVAGEHLMVADTAADFAQAVVDLLRDSERRARIALKARDWAVANLGWDTALDRYERVWAEAIERRRGHVAGG